MKSFYVFIISISFATFMLQQLFSPNQVFAQVNEIKGDANNDQKVDDLDYMIWLNQFGTTISAGTGADFNSDQKIDGIDYVIWINNYGSIQTAYVDIPHHMPTYTEEVEAWWQNHPFNPIYPGSIPVGGISNPAPIVNVKQQYAGNIQAAVDSLPAAGGTLFFEPGEYENNISIVGRSNIHFVSDGGASIVGPANGQPFYYSTTHPSTATQSIVGCSLAANYDAFANALASTNSPNHTTAVDCLQNLKGGFYFKNLTFDGKNTAYTALRLATIKDVVFDNVTFKNYLDSQQGHPGIVSAHQGDDNIWFRNCTFYGPNRYAVYLDGLHGGGIINSTVNGYFGSGTFLLLTNDDYSFDLNKNGSFEPNEQRNGNYIVVEGNQINTGVGAVAATTAHTLVKNNTVPGFMNGFVHFDVRNSNHGTVYQFYGNHVIGNHTQDTLTFFLINSAASCDPSKQTCAKVGKYVVSDNIIQNAVRFQSLVTETGPVDGPNVVSNNCVNGVCKP